MNSHNVPPRLIEVRQWAEEGTRTKERPCFWVAECEVGGVKYRARDRLGGVNALARQLMAARVGDGPLVVWSRRSDGTEIMGLRWRSLYAAAKQTYRENAGQVLRRVKYREPDFSKLKEAAE